MARRRTRNPTPGQWAAIGVSATVFSAVAYGALNLILKRFDPELDDPQTPTRRPPTPTPTPTPTPAPEAHECNPADATTWPFGFLCVHDGTRFVFVPTEEAERLNLETNCDQLIIWDDHGFPGEGHDELTPNSLQRLNSAVILKKSVVLLELADGLRLADIFMRHNHMIRLNEDQITALRSGDTVDVVTTSESDHSHSVRLHCVTREVPR